MADFTLANVRQLTRGVKTIFSSALNAAAAERLYLKVATEVMTNSHTVDYAWLDDIPEMKEWLNARDYKQLKDHKYEIAKKDWESSIYVMRDDFKFDRLGVVTPKVQQLAHAVVRHYNSLVFGLIPKNGNCFDGQPFFGAHTVGAKTYTNKVNAKLTETALFDGIEFMQTLENSQGAPIVINPNLLLVAPDLYKDAKKLLGSKQIDSSDNVAENIVRFEVIREMKPKTWCLLDTTQPLKPFILQVTKKGEVQENTKDMFEKKKVYYGIDTMDNAGYGFWQMAYFSSGGGRATSGGAGGAV